MSSFKQFLTESVEENDTIKYTPLINAVNRLKLMGTEDKFKTVLEVFNNLGFTKRIELSKRLVSGGGAK